MSNEMMQAISMELAYEIQTTNTFFKTIPDSSFAFSPHEKSMSMGKLASHIIEPLTWVNSIVNESVFIFDPQTYKPETASNQKELLALSDKLFTNAKVKLDQAQDEILGDNWKFMMGETIVFEMPKAMVLRAFVISHLIHHRGQLSVYMRLNNLPVPKAYGPTADDQSM